MSVNQLFAGFAILEDFSTQDEVRQLRDQAQLLIQADERGGEDAAVFSTTNQALLQPTLSSSVAQPIMNS